MYFNDVSIRHNVSADTYGTSIEYFFMTPDMPQIMVQSARKVIEFLKNNPDKVKIFQETYNIDLKIRQVKEKAGKLGIRA